MKRIKLFFVCLLSILGICLVSCGKKDDPNTITVCASELPHADVLNNCVKDILKEKGYKLEVKVLNWDMQNDAVAHKEYDANYFQHVPYLEASKGDADLFAACKVHYEPLGIYRGKSTGELASAKKIEICSDVSNAIRALQLLQAKNVITNLPVENGKLTFVGDTWTSENGVEIKLISEALLVTSIQDYDFACLPSNTAYTGHVNSELLVTKEDDPQQISLNANIIAARLRDYKNNETYKAKIDALCDAMLSEKVSQYFNQKYEGKMTCDSSSQIDLRSEI